MTEWGMKSTSGCSIPFGHSVPSLDSFVFSVSFLLVLGVQETLLKRHANSCALMIINLNHTNLHSFHPLLFCSFLTSLFSSLWPSVRQNSLKGVKPKCRSGHLELWGTLDTGLRSLKCSVQFPFYFWSTVCRGCASGHCNAALVIIICWRLFWTWRYLAILEKLI
jgi:hypothetical protein